MELHIDRTMNAVTTAAIHAIVARHPRRLVTLAHARTTLRDVDLLQRKALAAHERDDDASEVLYLDAATRLLARVTDYCARGLTSPWCAYEHLRGMA